MQTFLLKNDLDIARGTQKNCNDCQKKFSIIARQHQCKRCLKPVCSDCGNFRRQIYSPTFTLGEHRVCKNCKQSSTYIADLVKNQDLHFGQTKDTGKKWLKRMTIKPSTFGTDTSQHKVFTKEVFAELWGSYSFELRELVGMLTFSFKQDGVYNVVYNVYTTVISAAPQFNFAQVIHLIVYVLCFCSSDKAPFIVLYLLELKQNEKDFKSLVFSYLKAMPFKNELPKLEQYINYRLERYSDSFLINCLTIQCSKFLITKIFEKRNIEELLIFFATHIYVNRETLLARVNEGKSLLDNIMLRNCKLEEFISSYRYFKGKNLSGLFADSKIQDFDQSGLKRMKTINYDSEYSPKTENNSFGNQRYKPKLIARSPMEDNDRDKMDDSFSFYVQGDAQNLQVKSPSQNSNRSSKNMEENDNFSPQIKILTANQQSPFKKTAPQDVSSQMLLSPLPELMKPVRKNTDGPQYDRRSFKNCQNCQLSQQQYENIYAKYNEDKARWMQQKQILQEMKEKLSANIEKSATQDFIKKNKIIELEKTNIQNQNQLKQSQQKISKLQEDRAKIDQFLQKSKAQLKEMSEKLMNQTNENIKMSANLQKQKRNVKQARQMCIQTNKMSEALKKKVDELQVLNSQYIKRQANFNLKINNQEATINQYGQKVAKLQQAQVTLAQKNEDNSKFLKISSEQASQILELNKAIIQKDKQLQEIKREYHSLDTQSKAKAIQLQRLQSSMEKIRKQLKATQAKNEQLNVQLLALLTDNQKLKQQRNELASKKQQLEQDLKRNILLLSKINKEQTEKSSKLSSSQIQVSEAKALLYQREQELGRIQLESSRKDTNLIEAQKDVNELKVQLQELKKSNQLKNQQSRLLILQFQQRSEQMEKQLAEIKQQKEQLEEKTENIEQQLQQHKQLNYSLTNSDHLSLFSKQNQQKQIQIQRLKDITQKQAKQIGQLTEANKMLQNRLIAVDLQNKQLQLAKIQLLQQSTSYQHNIQQLNTNCNKLSAQIVLRTDQLSFLKRNYQEYQSQQMRALKAVINELQDKNKELLNKFSDISELMMQIQEQKMELADELFTIHQYLRQNGIKSPQ